ncbi:MAG: amidohydrolase family protein [Myxococcota bacterium]
MRGFAFLAALLALAGCGDDRTVTPFPDDGGTDANAMDGAADGSSDASLDGSSDGRVDGGMSTVAGPAEIVREGAGGYLLRGIVLTPDGPLDPGEVLVEGNMIACVAADCSASPGADTVTVIDTRGIISPGLIDSHNHLPYNFLPEWIPDPMRLFGNRYQWADVDSYEEHVLPYTARRSTGTHFCPAAKWGELRAIVHGTTTIQGQSLRQACINRLARNADHFHGLGYDHMQTTISSPRDITDSQAMGYVENFTASSQPTTRLAVHMGEGIEGSNIELEFSSFAGRDTRSNRHAGVSLLQAADGSYRGVGLLIHTVAIQSPEIMEIADTDSKMVWSPSSNLVLYGATAPIGEILDMGITVGIGPDWSVSGEDDILAEMRFALNWAAIEGVAQITPRRLWEMATFDGADVVGLAESIGELRPGLRADISVFSRIGPDPYAAVVESRTRDVRLVFIDGVAYYGDLALEVATAVNGECDMFDACGEPKFLCVRDTPGDSSRADETLDDLELQLFNILEGIGYPPEEQYGRGAELLPLANCQ